MQALIRAHFGAMLQGLTEERQARRARKARGRAAVIGIPTAWFVTRHNSGRGIPAPPRGWLRRRLGTISDARSQSTRRWQNAMAVSIGVAGSKILGFVTMRKTSPGRSPTVRTAVGGGQREQPGRATIVFGRVLAVGVDQDVHSG